MKERRNKLLRFLDIFFGIPLIWLMGAFHKKRQAPIQVKNIALLKSAGIGDTVLLSGIILDLKTAHPFANITLFCGNSNREMAMLIAGIRVIALPITRPLKSLRIIRKHRFDFWIDFDPWPRINALFSACSHAQYTIGFKTPKQWRHFAYDCPIMHSFECHEIENYRALVKPLNVISHHSPSIRVTSDPKSKCKIALHFFSAGSRADLKEWPKENWRTLIEKLLKWRFNILLTGSNEDKILLDEFAQTEKVENLAGSLTLHETARVLAAVRCLITVDTGIMHLAGAVDCPVISLHGPTSPKRWGAIGAQVIALTPLYPYTHCIQLGFEKRCRTSVCMKSITVAQVTQALNKILAE